MERAKILLMEIWPFIYRFVNKTLYFLKSVLRGAFKIALSQIR